MCPLSVARPQLLSCENNYHYNDNNDATGCDSLCPAKAVDKLVLEFPLQSVDLRFG